METTPKHSVVAVRPMEAILKPPVPMSTESTPAQEPSPKSVPESLQTSAPESTPESIPAAPEGISAAPEDIPDSAPRQFLKPWRAIQTQPLSQFL
ncbi:hypothetical protein ROHU_008861 [Labeo rohita]|uniref:Uncharacterized protein n=2 Tax=Labeo rohita TaxID=84645 RepID=A0A498LKQ5_LABRO|nr:hypothetical protein ROHU_032987 [Labeo rohita]RXN14931.1 hypothetical protein ROHU_008861 [Labeo rohita]